MCACARVCWRWHRPGKIGIKRRRVAVCCVCFSIKGVREKERDRDRHPSWCAAEGWRRMAGKPPARCSLACVMAAVREGTLCCWARLGRTGISTSAGLGTWKAGSARGSVQRHWCYVVILHHLKDHPLQPVAERWPERIGVICRWWPMKHHWFLHRVSQ